MRIFPKRNIEFMTQISSAGADASGGNTRSHPEHDGEESDGRWYYAGNGVGEQVGAGNSMKIVP